MSPSRFNPFPGLRPFQMEEEYLFFGREAQRQQLVGLLREQRLVAVLGASGSGKSSLVRAGLLPALFGGVMTKAGSHWRVAIMRPGGGPLANLASALLETELWSGVARPTPLELETTLARSGLGLIEAVRQARLAPDQNLLVVVDQFEELFRFNQSQSEQSTRDEAAAFVNLLLEATRQADLSIYVVLTMRSDFFGDCAQFEDLAEAINAGEYLVPRLTRDQKKQAIEGPVRVGGATIAPRLLQRLLNDVGDDPDQLPILQHALMRTWDKWAVDHTDQEPLDLRHYEAIGGMREALSRHADEVFAECADEARRAVAERVFKALTERGPDNRGIRRPTRLSQLAAIAGAPEPEVKALVEAFRQAGRTFLMPPEPAALEPGTVIDISHESLMRVWQRLRGWVEQEAQSARVYRRLADTAALHADGKAGLYRDPDLQIALTWHQTERPTSTWAERYHTGYDPAMAFLEQSAAARRAAEEAREEARRHELEQAKVLAETERRRAEEQVRFSSRLKWMVRGLGLVAMVALAALVATFLARQEAGRQAELAEGNRRSAQQQAERAHQEARIAQQQRDLAAERSAEVQQLAATLKSTLTRADFAAATEQLEEGKIGPSLIYLGRSLRTDPAYVPAAWQTVRALSEHTLPIDPVVQLQQDRPISSWALNLTKDVIATRDESGHGFLWNLGSGQRIAPLAEGKQVQRMIFTRDGQQIFTATPEDGALRGWHAHTGAPAGPVMKPGYGFGRFTIADGTNGGRLVAIEHGDGGLQVWDAAKGEAIAPKWKTGGKLARLGFSPDGQLVFGDFDDRMVGVWRAQTGEPVLPLVRHDLTVAEARFSPDSRFLVLSATANKVLRWWALDAPTQAPRQVELAHPLHGFRFHSASDRVVAAGWTEGQTEVELDLRVVDLASGQETARVHEPKLTLRPDISDADQLLVAGDRSERGTIDFLVVGAVVDQRTLKVWDLVSGLVLSQLPLQESAIKLATFSPEGGRLAIALANNQVRIWDVFTGQPLTEATPHKVDLAHLQFSPEGEKLFVFHHDDGAWLDTRDARTGKPLIEPFKLTKGFLQWLSPIEDRTRMVAATTAFTFMGDGKPVQGQGELTLWRSQPGVARQAPLQFPGSVRWAAFSPDSTRIMVVNDAGDDSSAYLWRVADRQLLSRLRHAAPLLHGSFSPDGKRLLTASLDHVARVWDLETEKVILKLNHEGEGGEVFRAYFSPDGRSMLTLTFGGQARGWDAQTGQPLFEPIRTATFVRNASFVPGGSRFALSPLANEVRVFETRTGREAFPPLKLSAMPTWVEFSPNGTVLFATSNKGQPPAWDGRTGQPLVELPMDLLSHMVAVHPQGEIIAIGSGNNDEEKGSIHLWRWRERRLLTEPLVIQGQADIVTFSPDGACLAALSSIGKLRIWDVGTGRVLLDQADYPRSSQTLRFSPDGQRLLVACDRGRVELLDLPAPPPLAPDWLPALAEAAAGYRLNDQGAVEETSPGQLAELRQATSRSAASDPLATWAKWFFADPQTRSLSPGAEIGVAEYARELTRVPGPWTNRVLALQLAPNDGLIYARLGLDLASSTSRTNGTAQATNHWNATAAWYADQATNLAPTSAEVWALRAGTLLAIGRSEAAVESARRALDLGERDPNARYFHALTLAARGEQQAAYTEFVQALDLLPEKRSELDWRNQRSKPYLADALREVMELDQRNPLEIARLGRRRLDDTANATNRKYWEARWLTRRATELLPEDAEIWRLRAEVLLEPDERTESLAAIRRAVDLDAQGQPDARQYAAYVRGQSELLERAQRYEESSRLWLSNGVPPRPSGASPLQVDLSRFYSASLWEEPHRQKGGSQDSGSRWEHLPRGLVTLAGIQFDVRGLVHLSGSELARGAQTEGRGYARTYPPAVNGVPVRSQAQWFHCLHTAGWGYVKEGTIVGRYRLHYTDGQTHELPLVAGYDLSDWLANPFGAPRRAQVAWEENSRGSYKSLYLSSWENPRPDIPIASVDLLSDMTIAAPMVVAITLENPKTQAELDNLDALTLAQEALAKVTRVQGLAAAGRAYADKLSQLALTKAPQEAAVRRLRAEVLVRSDQAPAAESIVDTLLRENPNDHQAWNLRGLFLARTGQREQALAAWRKALELLPEDEIGTGPDGKGSWVPAAGPWPRPSLGPVRELRKTYARNGAELLEATGQMGEARRFSVQASIPPRPTHATACQVDLGPHYNAALTEAWHQRPGDKPFQPVLESFPKGLVTLQGVDFDARGLIQVNDRSRRFTAQFPNEVSGIQVGVHGDQIHFLHGVTLNERFGTAIARFRIHYADGQTNDFPLVYGRDATDFWLPRASQSDANLAWRAQRIRTDGGDIGLCLSTWDNPRPEVEISRIDFTSALSEAAPFLLAITVEAFKPDAELEAVPPQCQAELAVAKINPKLRPNDRTKAYAQRLIERAVQRGAEDARVWRLAADYRRQLSEPQAALKAIERALALDAASAEAWQTKVELMLELQQIEELGAAQARLRQSQLQALIPARDAAAPTNLVDLSGYYTAALREGIHAHAATHYPLVETLGQLLTGVQTFGGVRFDTRGLVHLMGERMDRSSPRVAYPQRVEGIQVRQRGRRLHFLHGGGWAYAPPFGTVVARYVVHYADGEHREIPFVLGADFRDWVLATNLKRQVHGPGSQLAWVGGSSIGDDAALGLYLKSWENPRPETEITQVDFVSEMTDAAPFLVALTVEPATDR